MKEIVTIVNVGADAEASKVLQIALLLEEELKAVFPVHFIERCSS